MTFWDALYQTASFFWSPFVILLATLVAAVVLIAMTFQTDWLRLRILFGAGALAAVWIFASLIVFFSANGIHPFHW